MQTETSTTPETSTESMSTRLKSYEKEYETKVPFDKHIVVRIDGHKFSKFTKGFEKPFDSLLSACMEETTKELVEHFSAVTGYTQSDEITLIFPAAFSEKFVTVTTDNILDSKEFYGTDKQSSDIVKINVIEDTEGWLVGYSIVCFDKQTTEFISDFEELKSKYEFKTKTVQNQQVLGGRTQKMASLISGYTTMIFNKTFIKMMNELDQTSSDMFNEGKISEEESKTLEKRVKFLMKKAGNAWFDARVYGVDTKEEAFNSVMWRVRDAMKNSKSMFAQAYCSHKSLLNKNSDEQVLFCKETTGKDWNVAEDRFKYGIIVKREQYEKEVAEEFKTQSGQETTKRTRMVSFSIPMTTFEDSMVEMVMRKYK